MSQATFTLTVPSIGYTKSIVLKIPQCTVTFKAKNSDIKDGLFGFDTIPSTYKNSCKSDITALEKEYTPLKIEGEQYFVPWLSIRKGQTVTLKVKKDIKLKKEFESIAFEAHPDFDITPKSLIDADEIQIYCKNTNTETAQLKVKVKVKDIVKERYAGGINVFYPKPKTIDLEWFFVEITGNKKDYKKLDEKFDKTKLEALLKKGLNPALLDVNIKNATASIGNLTKHKELFDKSGIIKKYKKYHYIENKKKRIFTSILQKELQPDSSIISLYLVNRSCLTTGALGEDGGTFDVVAGFSPTGTGIAYGILDEEGNLIKTAVMHEIMHALGLRHTFESTIHKFKKLKTKNYMDYKGQKTFTWKWQWKKLHEYKQLK